MYHIATACTVKWETLRRCWQQTGLRAHEQNCQKGLVCLPPPRALKTSLSFMSGPLDHCFLYFACLLYNEKGKADPG